MRTRVGLLVSSASLIVGILILIFAWLVATAGLSETPTATASPFLTEQQAIAMAIKYALVAQPEISGSKVPPTNTHAQLMSFFDANKLVSGSDRLAPGDDPDQMVWVVSMDGLWTIEMPRQFTPIPSSPTDVPIRHFTFVLDAKTGAFMGAGGHP